MIKNIPTKKPPGLEGFFVTNEIIVLWRQDFGVAATDPGCL